MSPLWEQSLWPVPWIVVLGASVMACVMDVRSHRIPNLLTGPLFIGGLIWSGIAAGGWGLGDALGGCVLAALPFVLLYAFAGGGAGDAKMMGAIGAWLGLTGGLVVLASVVLCGGVIAIVYALWRREASAAASNLSAALTGVWAMALGHMDRCEAANLTDGATRKTQPMPYGTAILAGVTLAGVGVWLWRH